MTRVNYEIHSFWDLSDREKYDIIRTVKKDREVFAEYESGRHAVDYEFEDFEDFFYYVIADDIRLVYEVENDGVVEYLNFAGYDIPPLHIRRR